MIFLSFLIFCALKEASGVIYRLNGTEYRKLPPLYQLDDFYPCLQAPGDIYCTADAVLVSNTTNQLLNTIKEFSAQTVTHFNRTVVHRGVCVTQTCRQYLGNNTDINETLEACLNATLYNTHQLQVNLLKDSVRCTHYDEKIEIDAGDYIMAAVLALLLLLTVCGSLLDDRISGSRNIGARLILCFSLKRNWQRLTQASGEGLEPRQQQLKCFSCLKTVTTMIVIFGHSPICAVVNTSNPEFVETTYYNPIYGILYGGTLVVQTFFTISGFFLAYNILLIEEKTRVGLKMLPKGIILRWLRLTPPFAMMLAFVCTWLRHTENGPYFKPEVGVAIQACRRDWYYLMLYVNNFVDNSQCMAHTWYLGADMQLSVLGLFLFCLASSARARKMAVGAAIVLGLLTPALHTYIQDLNAILLVSPETVRHYFVEDPTFNNLYKRGHTNLVCYAIGLAVGMIVYHLQEKTFDIDKYKKYRAVYWALVPLAVLLCMSSSIFYIDGIHIPLAVRMVYSSAVKAVYGLILALFLLGTIFKLENWYRPVTEWAGWATPGRVAYCAFLVHETILRTLLADHTSSVRSTLYQIAAGYFSVLVISFLVAVPLWMLVEAPCTQLVKVCLMPSKMSNLERSKSVSLATQVVVLGSKETVDIKL